MLRWLVVFTLLTVAGAAAGAVGARLRPGDVAVVGNMHISKARFDELMSEAQANFKAQGQPFPKAGTSAYASIRSEAVTLLVQQAETQAEAAKLGLTVTNKDLDNAMEAIKKSCCGGSQSTYVAKLKQQDLTDAEVRAETRANLYSQVLSARLTKGIKVAPAAIPAYYRHHLSAFTTPAKRNVRYILVGKTRKNAAGLAASLAKQLKGAPRAKWCTLAKKYSQDPSSSGKCGEAAFAKGQTVPEFDKALFSLATNDVDTVNSSSYGWFVIEPTAAEKPATTSPEAKVAKKIKTKLLTAKRQAAVTKYTANANRAFCRGKIAFGAGYKPSPDPCAKTG